jgi:hypothetical protein
VKGLGKISALLATVAVVAAPLAAAAPDMGSALRGASIKAISSKLRAGMVARLNKKIVKRNGVELAQLEGAAGAGASAGGAGAGAGAAGAGAAGAGAAGAGAAAAGAGAAAAGGLGVAGAVAGVAAAAGVATAASSGGNDSSP